MQQTVRVCWVQQLYLSMRMVFYSYPVVNPGSSHVNPFYKHLAVEADIRLLTLRVN